MYNCLILGSGRSGTSMVAGILSNAGYYMGSNLIPPRAANPKGFFESPEINRKINEEILRGHLPRFTDGQRWLGVLPRKVTFTKPKGVLDKRLRAAVSKTPFCYKDPRISYTLPIWQPYLENTKFICVFRHPASTALSIVKECLDAKYLQGLNMSRMRAYAVWVAMYDIIVHRHRHTGEWLFVHYDQVFFQKTLEKISTFLGAFVNADFPEKRFKKPVPGVHVPKTCLSLYNTLNELSIS